MIITMAPGRIIPAIGAALLAAGCYSAVGPGSGDLSTDPDVDADAQDDQHESLPEDCPEPQGLQTSFSLQGLDDVDDVSDLELKCLVASVTSEDMTSATVALDCTWEDEFDRRLTLTLSSSAGFSLFLHEREMVILQYAMEIPWWTDRWFALREPGEYVPGPIITAGVDASGIAPFGHDIRESSWYSPIFLGPVADLCEIEPTECYDEERIAIEVAGVFLDDPSVIVFDDSTGSLHLGDEIAGTLYNVHLMTAVNRSNFRCTDIPDSWFSALIFMVPGD